MLSESQPETTAEPQQESVLNAVHALLRFLIIVRYRKRVVLASLAAAVLLGALHYATATRKYSAKASLLVMYSGPDMQSPTVMGNNQSSQNWTPTFQALITTTKVLEEAVPHLQNQDHMDFAGAAKDRWPAIIQAGLSTNVVRNTNIINIEYCSNDPKAGVGILNAVVQAYVEFLDKTRKGTAGEIINVLTREKSDLAEKLAKKEAEMLDARRQLGDLGIRQEGANLVPPTVQNVMAFSESLTQTQKRRIELEASLAAIQSALRNGENLQQYVTSLADPVGKEILFRQLGLDSQDSATLSNLERSLLDERLTLKTMQEHLGPSHPEVLAKIEKIRMAEQYIIDYHKKIKQWLDQLQTGQLGPMLVQIITQKLNEARQLEAAIQKKFDETKEKAIGLNGQLARLDIIEHDVKWLRNLHDVLLNRIASIDLKHEGPDIRTALVEEPTGGDTPIYPKLYSVLALSLACGLAVGLALVCLLDVMDDRFRSLDELQRQLGIPVLTIIRQLQAGESSGLESVHMRVAPSSPESEAFRTLRTALALSERDTRRLVISSTEPGDGKTTILANLAVCFAQGDKKTILIDADLRRPGLTSMLEMRSVEGLSRVLAGQEDVGSMALACIRHSGIDGLDVLPSGARVANPTELLNGPRLAELLAWAETIYDQILVDCPPALITSDVAIIGRLVDGMMLVVQPDKNRRRQVLRSLQTLTALKVPVMGIIVNRVDTENDHGYYGYSSGYGYGYGYQYGDGKNQYGYHDDASEEISDNRPADESAETVDRVTSESIVAEDASDAWGGDAGIVPRRVA